MSRERPEELWAAALLSAALGLSVVLHDDGSRSGMYDLRVDRDGVPVAAVEVVAAADAESIEFWNLMNGGGRWVEAQLAGGWMVTTRPTARVNKLREELPTLLEILESRGVTALGRYCSPVPGLDLYAESLGVLSAHQSGTDFAGSIYVTIERDGEFTGGCVSQTGDAFAEWLSGWVAGPECADVRAKLASSGLHERHAFVILPAFTTAPFAGTDLLWRDDPPLPTGLPVLPAEITHLWAVTTWRVGSGIRWSPEEGWRNFSKQPAVGSDQPQSCTTSRSTAANVSASDGAA